MMRRLPGSLLLVLLLLPMQLFALPSDSKQPIAVEADSLEVRDQENISIYQGNVSLTQGSLEISSQRLVIYFNEARELVLMEMTGAPARFRLLDNDRRELRGRAEKINYSVSKSLLELLGNARFSHSGDSIEGSEIRVNTETNSIQAGRPDSDERVKMLIQPKTE